MNHPQDVHIHYHRPPERTDRFVQRLVSDNPAVKITFSQGIDLPQPLMIQGQVALEAGADVVWFTFPGAWHDIGRFHRADGALTGIYANILTPCTFEPGRVWHTTDLFLDLWIPATEGRVDASQRIRPQVLDREELQRAESEGWIAPRLAKRAREEAASLEAAAMRGSWPPGPVWKWSRERVLALLR